MERKKSPEWTPPLRAEQLYLSTSVNFFFFLLSFSRFGNLIEVYLVSGKNVGYAKYADRISANDAITTLHGKILNGVRLKVMLADSPREESNKRQRTY